MKLRSPVSYSANTGASDSSQGQNTPLSFKNISTCVGIGLLALTSSLANAEVKSLSSSELTETYVRDSTIIITPKQLEASTQSSVSALTIAPVEGIDQDITEIQNFENHLDRIDVSRELDDETLRNAAVELAVNPLPEFEIASFQEINTVPVADLLQDERYRAPDGTFNLEYIGTDLGISRSNDQLTFSIGNPIGVDPILLTQGIDEGPVLLEPREGGGFDLTINIPEALLDNQQ